VLEPVGFFTTGLKARFPPIVFDATAGFATLDTMWFVGEDEPVLLVAELTDEDVWP
jgi:hypothetical protein